MFDSEKIPRILVEPSDGGSEEIARIDKMGFATGVKIALEALRDPPEDVPAPLRDPPEKASRRRFAIRRRTCRRR